MNSPVTIPKITANDLTVEIGKWLVKSGTRVEVGDELCELITSKADFLLESSESGFFHIRAENGQKLKVGTIIGFISDEKNPKEINDDGNSISEKSYSQKAAKILKDNPQLQLQNFNHNHITSSDLLGKNTDGESNHSQRSSLTVYFSDRQLTKKMKGKNPLPLSSLIIKPVADITVEWLNQTVSRKNPHQTGFNYVFDLGSGVYPVQFKEFSSWNEDQWHQEIQNWQLKIARKKMAAGDITSGLFTLSDLSTLSVAQFEPVLMSDQFLTLGFGRDSDGNRLSLTAAFDHKDFSGRQVASLLQKLTQKLTDSTGSQ